MIFRTLMLTVLLATSACGGGNDDSSLPDGSRLISGGGTDVDSSIPANCLNCTLENELNVIDGNLASAATFFVPGSNASIVSIMAIAQPGTVFPAGTRSGVKYSLPNGFTSGTLSLITYLDGTLVDSFVLLTGAEDQLPRSAVFATTDGASASFNEVELSFNKQSSSTDLGLNVFDFATSQ